MLKCKNAINISGAISAIQVSQGRYVIPLSRKKIIHIMCLGRLVWDKRFDLVIQSISLLNIITPYHFCLHIVGEGPEKNKLFEMSSGNNVVFHSSLDDLELDQLFNQIDIFCTPDWADFKLTMFESLSGAY